MSVNSQRLPKLYAYGLLLCLAIAACDGNSAAQKRKHFENGNGHLEAGRYQDATLEYLSAIQLDPKFAEARIQLAIAYEKLDDGQAALGEYLRAADLLPDNAALQLTAGKYLLAARRVNDALTRADAVIKRDPGNIEALILRGNALGGLNEVDGALDAIEEALRLDPSRGATYTHLGLLESARGARAEAERAFQKAIELAPGDVDGYLALGNFYWSLDRLPDAEREFERALSLQPDDQGANRALAVFALATGRVGRAEKYLTKLVDLSDEPGSAFTLAEYYIATNRAPEAVALLEPLAKGSRVPAARRKLARALAAAGDSNRTSAVIDEILKQTPGDSETLLLKGQLLLDAKRHDEALETVRAAVDAKPDSIGAQFTLGRIHAARGDRAGAEAAFREVLKRNPGAVAASVELATLQLASGVTSGSLQVAEAAVAQDPRSLDANLALVRGLLANGQLDRADTQLAKLKSAAPNNATVHVQLGVLAASRGEATMSRASFERALSLDPSSIEGLAGVLALDMKDGRLADARARLGASLQREPVSPQMLMLAARTYASMKDLAAAERVLRRAIEVDSTMAAAYSMLAEIYLVQGRLDAARQEFDALAKRHSKPGVPLTMSGIILESQGQLQQARQRYEQAVEADAKALVAANNLAWLYAEAGERLGDALRLARQAAELAPDNPDVLDTLGWVYYKSSLPELAIQPLGRAVSADPKRASYRYHLGMACAKAGDHQRSRAELSRALELDEQARWAAEAKRVLASLPVAATP